MEARIKELIAIGASVTANCQPCLEYHVRMAREHGADEAEIHDAIGVGKTVRQGARRKLDSYADALLEEGPAEGPADGADAKDDDCACS